ncbi:MAG: hypothetical protein AAGA54_36310 [Myxococcota bacterium]
MRLASLHSLLVLLVLVTPSGCGVADYVVPEPVLDDDAEDDEEDDDLPSESSDGEEPPAEDDLDTEAGTTLTDETGSTSQGDACTEQPCETDGETEDADTEDTEDGDDSEVVSPDGGSL